MAIGSSRRKSGFGRLLSRGLLIVVLLLSIAIYGLGATDDPRLAPLRRIALKISTPVVALVSNPIDFVGDAFSDMSAFLDVYEQNRRLREDIVQLTQWREVARRLEAENASLRALHNVSLAPKYDYVTGQIVGNSGGGFVHSATINVGRGGGVRPGAAALDGSGVAGRVIALGENAARILLLTDLSSRVPVMVEPEDEEDDEARIVRGILAGDNTAMPLLEFPTQTEPVPEGARVVTSGDGGVFPKGVPVGAIRNVGPKEVRVQPAADFERLEFVRILLDRTDRTVDPDAVLVVGPGARRGDDEERER